MLVDRSAPSRLELERLLADVFRRAHWRVRLRPPGGGLRPDMIVEGGGKRFLIEMKRSSEGRGDRLIPLLSQAILQAQAAVRQFPEPVVPLAVVAAERVPQSVAEQVKQFAAQFAPDTGVGIIDSHGLRAFAGHGLEALDARPSRPVRSSLASPHRLPSLFSDLNQWMLKILLGQSIPESLLSIPRAEFRSATQLAAAARVSVMSASRFVRQLAREALLEDRGGHLQVVRVEHLLGRWAAANQQAVQEIPVRWIIRKEPRQLLAAVRAYALEADAASRSRSKPRSGRIARARPRCAIGLFAAADALGFGFVHGVPPHIYLERLDLDVLRQLGLSLEDADRRADAYLRVPTNREAVFRAAVTRDGLPVSDVLQVWLDVSSHPARGRGQADEIRKRALGSLFGNK